jgi:hypothetical protein
MEVDSFVLPVVMQTQLHLGFGPVIGDLAHKTQLNFEVLLNRISQGAIGSVAVKELHGPAVSNVALAIDEQFVVEGKIKGPFVDDLAVQGNINKQIVPVARSEILILHPSLLVSETMSQVEDASYFLRKEGFLVNSVFSIDNI